MDVVEPRPGHAECFDHIGPGTHGVPHVHAAADARVHISDCGQLRNTLTRVDLDLQTGSVTETVLLTTAPPMLQSDRADISTKIEAGEVADVPLGTNRNFQSLLNLVPGTSPATFQHSQFFNAQSALQTEATDLEGQALLFGDYLRTVGP